MGRKTGVTRQRPRTCSGCGEESPKRDMVRVVRCPDGRIEIDTTGRTPGRGAYLCFRKECVLAAKKRDTLSRALKSKVPVELYDDVLTLLAGEVEGEEGRNGGGA
ncbi:RNase P modulator RnpM [Aminiphilus circumscriptus]|jgi:predicted RNA-binding protein YlxR (DUF448 family)|uniref:RNase P modulator RnpM n=1 Tax=Aminiphilus circumscriptus TaxID=290732 RepID=UPI000A065374|nr:YlxR family protein [Aminiphilus circumscriptus]